MSDPAKIVYFVAPLVVVVLAALIYAFGYPLLIALADLAALIGVASMVALTARDLIASKRAAREASTRSAAQSAGSLVKSA